jgi:hypothetical protein
MWNNGYQQVLATSIFNAPSSYLNVELFPVIFTAASLFSSQSSSSNSLPEFFTNLKNIQGDLSFNNGSVTSNITSPFGLLEGTFNVGELGNYVTDSLQQLNGNLNLIDGILVNNQTTSANSFDLANFTGNLVGSYFREIQGTFPLENGVLDITYDNINGTLNLGNGKMVTNLNTRFGQINSTFDFPDDSQIPFTTNNSSGILDFATGQFVIDLIPNESGDEISIPIDDLSGNLDLLDGIGNIIPIPFGDIAANFDFAQLMDDSITQSLQETGTVSFNNGVMNINIPQSTGTMGSSFDISQLGNYVNYLQQAEGVVNFANGVLTSNVNTPFGQLIGSIDLNTLSPNIN